MERLFEQIANSVVFEFDNETNQFCIINDNTPGIYWIWNTKKEAINEYLSSLGDLILISDKEKNETMTIA